MLRILTVLALACLSLPALGSVDTAQTRPSRCPEGHPERGDLGFEYLLCVGGRCSVNLRRDRGFTHDFSIEPRIQGIRPHSPAAGRLQDGDLLIAVDGVLITTMEGGWRLANLKPGVPVTLRIRRDRREMDLVVVPELGCNMPRLAVEGGDRTTSVATTRRATSVRPAAPSPAAPPVDFGMALECDHCGWYASPQGARWQSRGLTVVRSVEPGGPAAVAGVQAGDQLIGVGGKSIVLGIDAGDLTPGRTVTLRVRRGEDFLNLDITPRKRQTTPF